MTPALNVRFSPGGVPGPATVLLALLAAAGCVLPAPAQPAEVSRHFDEGNRHYEQGRYPRALEAYRQALAQGYASGALYYNMGNTYVRLGELGQAVRHYEKARRLMPGNPELQHNLAVVRDRLADRFTELPRPFWAAGWAWLSAAVGSAGFFIAGFLFYGLAMGLLGHRIWTGTRAPWHRRALAVFLILGVLLLGAAFLASSNDSASRSAVVVADEAPLRDAPEAAAPSGRTLHEGALLGVLRTRNGWTEVRLPDGFTGWLRSEALADV